MIEIFSKGRKTSRTSTSIRAKVYEGIHFDTLSLETHGTRCRYEGDILLPTPCETCKCVNGLFECTVEDGCDVDLSKYQV